jgi:hypothetical protein
MGGMGKQPQLRLSDGLIREKTLSRALLRTLVQVIELPDFRWRETRLLGHAGRLVTSVRVAIA